MNIQTIDFKRLMNPAVSKALVQSLQETGFAIVTNHGISKERLDTIYGLWESYFKLEQSVKNESLFKIDDQRGYYPFKSENAKGYPAKDLKEFYHFYADRGTGGFHSSVPFATTMDFFYELEDIGLDLLNEINDNSPEEVKAKFSQSLERMARLSDKTLLRILHYPQLNEDEDPNSVRAAAHEDINLITLLPAATQPGLEVMDINGNWHKVNTDPGAIIVNIGDMLQEASGGFYKSTTHRVVNPDGANTDRYSMPLFIHPHPSVVLSQRHTAQTYLDERLRELGLK